MSKTNKAQLLKAYDLLSNSLSNFSGCVGVDEKKHCLIFVEKNLNNLRALLDGELNAHARQQKQLCQSLIDKALVLTSH